MQFFFPASVKGYILFIAVMRFEQIRHFRRKSFACENIEMVWDSVPLEILGQDEVTGLKIRNIKNK